MADFQDGRALGRSYRAYMQNRNDSCGCAAVRNAAYLLTGVAPTEQAVRDVSGVGQRMVSSTIAAAVAAIGGTTVDQGTTKEELIKTLRSFGLKGRTGKANSQGLLGLFATANRSRAFLALITWQGGGNHWVLVPFAAGSSMAVIDSWYGVQVASTFPSYKPAATDGSSPSARFTGEYIEITT